MKQKTHKKCKNPDCEKMFKLYRTTDQYCSFKCETSHKGKKKQKINNPINKVSKKQKIQIGKYIVARLEFLGLPDNKYCVIKGPNCTKIATTIEHSCGRSGYADDWARENGITKLNDVRFFKAACGNCNFDLENNPELSKKHQLSKITGKKKE